MALTRLHSISPKNHRKILILIVLTLITIFLFTKHTLEPSLSLHTTTTTTATQSHIPSSPISLPEKQESVTDRGDDLTEGFDNVGDSDSAVEEEEEDKQIEGVQNESLAAGGTVKKKKTDVVSGSEEVNDELRKCDLYKGKWVNVKDDDDEYPIYEAGSCPYVDEAFDCQTNGRADSAYLKWRWKPDGCDLPRFNATDFLERLRGKKLMLVGDSMNRNQFESILCLLREGLPNKTKMYEIHGYKITKEKGDYVFKFEDYDCSVQFVHSHFLVREGIRVNAQGNSNPTLSIDQIDKYSGRWKSADIIVFNTGHWWNPIKTARGKNYFKEGDVVYPEFDAVEAYRKSLKTWAKWIDNNIDTKKQTIFYRGYTNTHFRGGDWDSGGSCKGETDPILNGTFLDNYPLKMKIVEEVIKEMQVPVILLNVTRLSNFRKDGHPSIYGKSLTSERKRRRDCSHWCLPGVPDAWNELIYVTLLLQQYSSAT